MKFNLALVAALVAGSAVAASAQSGELTDLRVSDAMKTASPTSVEGVAVANSAQGNSPIDQFVGKFTVVSCNTEWKKGDRSMLDYNNSSIKQLLPDPGVDISVERKDTPQTGVTLLVHANGKEISFEYIDQPSVKSHKINVRDPEMETAPLEEPQRYQEDYYVTKYPDLNLDSTGSSRATVLTRTESGWAVKQHKGDTQGTRTLVTGYLHHSSLNNDFADNTLELSTDGRLTYHVREHGEYRSGGTDYRGKHLPTDKWDVTQDCVFQRDSSKGPDLK